MYFLLQAPAFWTSFINRITPRWQVARFAPQGGGLQQSCHYFISLKHKWLPPERRRQPPCSGEMCIYICLHNSVFQIHTLGTEWLQPLGIYNFETLSTKIVKTRRDIRKDTAIKILPYLHVSNIYNAIYDGLDYRWSALIGRL